MKSWNVKFLGGRENEGVKEGGSVKRCRRKLEGGGEGKGGIGKEEWGNEERVRREVWKEEEEGKEERKKKMGLKGLNNILRQG